MSAVVGLPALASPTARILREIARGGLAAVMTGVLVAGVGGRIAMRISALMDPSATRRTTEAGARVGEITLGGSVGFVVFVGVFTGMALALMWVVVQRWLPESKLARYVGGGVIGIAMGGRFAIDGRNIDFLILGPQILQVGLFVLLAAIAGAVLVRIDGWLQQRLPKESRAAGVTYGLIAAFGLVLTVPGTFLLFTNGGCQCASLPRLPGAALLLVAGWTLWAWIAEARSVATPLWLNVAARSSVVLMAVAGLAHLGGEIAHFM